MRRTSRRSFQSFSTARTMTAQTAAAVNMADLSEAIPHLTP